jgi:molybdenum cofactor cytidylyltransferase
MHGIPCIAAVILAAGGSSRLGFPKQLMLHEGDTLVNRAALAARRAGLDPVIVVLGADSSRVAAAIDRATDVVLVMNDEWQTGQASSLRAGIRSAMSTGSDTVLVMLVDQLLVDEIALRKLIAQYDDDHRIIAAAYHDTIGAPALIACEFFSDLMQLSGDSGAGRWLRDRKDIVTQVALPEAMIDIDTPSDAAGLTKPE